MLSETFIAASANPPKLTSANSSLLKDAGIFIHSFQPQPGLRSTLKKSMTAPGCLAISDCHIFAAQSGKAVVHVYNRQKGSQEATIPFPERIHSLALVAEGAILALGTEGGSIILWETCTGRQLSTPQSHLQAVTALAVDPSGNFLLSGSSDASVLVWSLSELLSFQSTIGLAQHDSIEPRHTLAAHRSAITCLTVGHSTTSSNIAISASKDNTAIIWNYQTGERLKTVLLCSTPICLALDPIDRAFYAGFEDGSIQLVNFYPSQKGPATLSSIHDSVHASTPLQPSASDLWAPPFPDIGATLSISLSYDSTTLLSTHTSGKILAWDISQGSFRSTLVDYPGAPITNIHFLSPNGFPNQKQSQLKIASIVKPRPQEPFSSSKGRLSATYDITAQFSESSPVGPQSAISRALTSPIFPSNILASSITELATWNTQTSHASVDAAQTPQTTDFVSIDGAMNAAPAVPNPSADFKIQHLEKQVAHLKNLQVTMSKHTERLTRENVGYKKKEEERIERMRRKAVLREGRAKREWDALGKEGMMDVDGAFEERDEVDKEEVESGDEAETSEGE